MRARVTNVQETAQYVLDSHQDLALLDRLRAAALDLLLTPAPTVADLNRKKTMRRSRFYTADANEHRIDAAIAKDEEWLRENARPQRVAR